MVQKGVTCTTEAWLVAVVAALRAHRPAVEARLHLGHDGHALLDRLARVKARLGLS